MKFGFDLDDVVLDFFPNFLKFYNNKYHTNFLIEDIFSYHIWGVGIGKTKDEAVGFVDEFYKSEDYDKIPFVKGARESLDRLGGDNELFFITSRYLKYKPKTEKFVQENFGEARVFFTEDFYNKNGQTKAEVCRKLGVDCYVEDCFEYAFSCAEGGIRVLLFDKPWNQNREHKNIIRVKNWKEIMEKLEVENA